jgi:hypothetical protein
VACNREMQATCLLAIPDLMGRSHSQFTPDAIGGPAVHRLFTPCKPPRWLDCPLCGRDRRDELLNQPLRGLGRRHHAVSLAFPGHCRSSSGKKSGNASPPYRRTEKLPAFVEEFEVALYLPGACGVNLKT